jgi:hypothetical protein
MALGCGNAPQAHLSSHRVIMRRGLALVRRSVFEIGPDYRAPDLADLAGEPLGGVEAVGGSRGPVGQGR